MVARLALALALLAATHGALAQSPPTNGITVHGRRHHDGCVAFDGALAWHELPAGDDTITLPAASGAIAIDIHAQPPRGLHGDEPDTAQRRIETVARRDMRRVLEIMQPRMVARFSSMRLPSGERWLGVTSHVGAVDDRAVFQARLTSSPSTPILGSMIQNLAVDVRQCPIAYQVPTEYGPIACNGRRFEFELGPSESLFPGVVRYLVVDFCFDARRDGQERVTHRSYVVRGAMRSIFPIVRESEMRQFVVSIAQEVAWHAAIAIEQAAGTQFDYARRTERDEPATATRQEQPSAPVDSARCDAAIARATQRYFSLVHAVWPGPEPANADLDRTLEDLLGALDNDQLATLARADGVFELARMPFVSALERSDSPIRCAVADGHPSSQVHFDCHDARDSQVRVSLEPVSRGSRRFAMRMCAWNNGRAMHERLPEGVTSWSRCSDLAFDPAPHIEHSASVVDAIDLQDPSGTELRIEYDGERFTPRERFVESALVRLGRSECVARIGAVAPLPLHVSR
jgi:hypothetical protein